MKKKKEEYVQYHGPVNILGREHTIVWDDTIIDGNGMDCEGLFDYERERILLKTGMTRGQAEEAILHEIIEGVNSALELNLKHHQITSLARGLWAASVRYIEPDM